MDLTGKKPDDHTQTEHKVTKTPRRRSVAQGTEQVTVLQIRIVDERETSDLLGT